MPRYGVRSTGGVCTVGEYLGGRVGVPEPVRLGGVLYGVGAARAVFVLYSTRLQSAQQRPRSPKATSAPTLGGNLPQACGC